MDEWVLLEIGCAECGNWPLVAPRGTFPTSAAAAESIADELRHERWKPHPQGGFIAQWGSGAFWIAPTAALSLTGAVDELSEYEAPREYATP